jgi:transposase-like protein
MIEIQLHKIINVSLCWDILRSVRWAEGVSCPKCSSASVVKNGKDTAHPDNQHYRCKSCGKYFDDLTDTIFSDSQQPLHHWITVLYLMNLNVSNLRIAKELDVCEATAQSMCSAVREGVVKKT